MPRQADTGTEIPPIRPSAAIRAAYQKRLDALIDEMQTSIVHWIAATYRANTPEIAQDESPARTLQSAMRKLGRRWQRRFDELAPKLADYFATAARDRVDTVLKDALRQAGFTVQLKLTAAQNDVLQATIGENVSLIKSIAQQHLKNIEGQVMRSVQTGRDLGTLAKELEHTYGVTKRRAAFIARSQNNIATAAITRTRQKEIGITQAKWKHSAGGRHPRPEHVAFSGQLYDIEKGAYLEGKWTWPGVEPNCRCVSISVIPALGV